MEEFLFEAVVLSLHVHELLLCALLQHLTVVHEDDVVRSLHCLQPMGNHQHRLALCPIQNRLDLVKDMDGFHILFYIT